MRKIKSNRRIRRKRRFFKVLKLAVILGVTTFLTGRFYSYLTHSESLRIKEIIVEGNRTIPDRDILSAAGITLGENIFGADLNKAKKRLKSFRQIAKIDITRNFPGSIHIRMTERSPIARVQAGVFGGNIELVDREGVVFPGKRTDIPVIINVSEPDELRGIVNFLCELERIDSRFYRGVERIDGKSSGNIKLEISGECIVKWGVIEKDFKYKLEDLKAVIADLNRVKGEFSVLDARFWEKAKRNIIVK